MISEWVSDYLLYEMVPGVSIISNHIANQFDLHLVSLAGRANCRYVRVFESGFDQVEKGVCTLVSDEVLSSRKRLSEGSAYDYQWFHNICRT